MTTELSYLTWITLITAVMWVPYILNCFIVRGIFDTVGYPDSPKPLSPWAARMKTAHANAIENLAIFATLVLIAHVLNISNDATIMASLVLFLVADHSSAGLHIQNSLA